VWTAKREQGDFRKEIWHIDAKNVSTMIILNLIGIVWIFIFSFFMLGMAELIRPEWHFSNFYDMFFLFSKWLVFLVFIAIYFISVWLHEIMHGVFFLLFTREKPKIAFRFLYASCAAEGWYLPTNSYLITTLAPFILLTTFGIIALKFVSLAVIPYLLFALILNGGGSIGDIWVAIKVSWYGRKYNLMVTDWGSGCAIYTNSY